MRIPRWWPFALLLAVAGAILPWLLSWSDLPDPVATHWGLSGDPDGHTARAVAAAMTIVVVVMAAAAAAVVTTRHSGWARWAWIVYGLTGLGAGVAAVTALVNRGADNWRQADMPLLWLVPMLAPMVGLALVGSRVAEAAEAASAVEADRPAVSLRPGELATWTGTSQARWPLRVGAVLLVAAAVEGTAGVAVALAAVAALLVLLGSVRVTVGAHGLRVRSGLLAWPAVTLPLARIDHAEAIDAQPAQWGGWGYRGSLHLMRRAAWVVRRGEGLRVDLTDHRVFVVTVDEAKEAAAVLNGLLARQPNRSGVTR